MLCLPATSDQRRKGAGVVAAMDGLLLLLVQIGVVLVAARLVGLLFRALHQPQVVGEMVAGILLGPSLLGWAAPGLSAAVFPADSLGLLTGLSQIGLLFFMFLVGLELDGRLLKGRGDVAVVTSHVSIVVPFFLGAALAYYLYPLLSNDSVPFIAFALFLGAAMSVTAFPVLARILAERNLIKTRVGALTIACAAVDDVTAWTLLAVVIAIVRADAAGLPLWVTIVGTALFVGVMMFVARPLLRRLETYFETRGRLTQDALAVVLLALLVSAILTEWLGIHALFGAFMLGVAMPRDRDFVREVKERLEDVTTVFFLPLFFAATGLRTNIGLVHGQEMWLLAGLILLVAVLGKFGGSTVAARVTGLSWREAGALGVLMNTRGLMELVILTIGFELGVISPALFTMMVLMALATTFMTTPILELIYPARVLRRETAETGDADAFTVLIPVALPSSGPALLRLAGALAPRDRLRVYALHLSRAESGLLGDVSATLEPSPGSGSAEALLPLIDAANEPPSLLRPGEESAPISVRPLAFVSREPGRDIADTAHRKGADLVLIGWHKPVVSQSVLGGTVYDVLRHTRADVGVYIARNEGAIRRVLVPFARGPHDQAALTIAGRLADVAGAEVTILHVIPPTSPDEPGAERAGEGDTLPDGRPLPEGVRLLVVESRNPLDTLVEIARGEFDLVVAGASELWGLEPSLFSRRHERLARECPASVLIVRSGRAPARETRVATRATATVGA